MSKSQLSLPPPTPIALVICDNVYQETGGKRALVGLFNRITTKAFPAAHGKLCVFVSITSLRSGTICKLEIVNSETDVPVVTMQGPLPDDNPTTVCDLVFELKNLQFPTPGQYYVRFWGNESLLIQRPFEIGPPAEQAEQPRGD